MTIVANTKLFNVRDSLQYYQPIQDVSNNQFYVFAAKCLPWPNTAPVAITEAVAETEYTIFEQMIFGKIITSDDVKPMIDRYDWTSGTVYAAYDDQDADLFTKAFFVVSYDSGAYHVFKCMENAGGIASTSQPLFTETSSNEDIYVTTDGYHWKYMYTIDTVTYNKFTTPNYIPVVPDTLVSQFSTNGAIDSIIVESGGNTYLSYTNGYFTAVSISGNTIVHAIADTSSSNNGFYTGSGLYILSGTGAGQIRKISDYIITTTQKQVVVASAFSPQPDLTSQYSISPYVNILGDGTNAAAISVVNTTSKAIQRVEMVSTGQNYTYANVYITGNTGSITANSASLRAIVSPRGGHGSNASAELNANKVGISVTFANNEANAISTQNDYSRIGVLKNPSYANVELTYSSNVGAFSVGEQIVQHIGGNTALNTFTSIVQNYTYTVGNYITLTFGSPYGITSLGGTATCNTANAIITGTNTAVNTYISAGYNIYVTSNSALLGTVSSVNTTAITLTTNAAYAITTNAISYSAIIANNTVYQNTSVTGTVINVTGNTLIVRTDSGTFIATSNVLYTPANTTVIGNSSTSVTAGFTNSVFGLDSGSNATYSLAATNAIDVYLNGSKIYNHGVLSSNTPAISYSSNSTVVSLWNKTLSNTDIISVNKYVTTGVHANSQYSAYGTLQSANSTVLKLTDARGVFITSNTANISGAISGAYSNVSSIIQPSEVFSQTTKLTGVYTTANTFALDDYCQQDTPNTNGAFGYIQSINTVNLGGTATCNTANAIITTTNTAVNTYISAGQLVYIASNNALLGTAASVNTTAITLTTNAAYAITANVINYAYDFYITNVKGIFESSGSKTIQSLDGNKIVSITALKQPDLIKYTGDIVYAENITAVSRSNTQSETVRLVLKFY